MCFNKREGHKRMQKSLWATLMIGCSAWGIVLLVKTRYWSPMDEPPSTPNGRDNVAAASAAAVFNADCKCRSLFSLDSCGDNQLTNEANHLVISKALTNLRLSKRGGQQSINGNIHEISRLLPRVFNPSEQDEDLQHRLGQHLTYIPCQIHSYSKEDIRTCLKRRTALVQKPVRLAFLGDSHVRNLMEAIIVGLGEDFTLKVDDPLGLVSNLKNFIGHRIKHDMTFIGGGIQLDFYWSTSFYSSGSDRPWNRLRRSLVEGTPDFVYFDIGNWPFLQHQGPYVVEEVMYELNKERDFFKQLSQASVVLMRSNTPSKTWLHFFPNMFATQARDDIVKLAWLLLNDTGVGIWDTITPVYLKEIDECRDSWKAGSAVLPSRWNCHDSGHFSLASDALAGNMIWNLICNKVMNLERVHCCA